jgi:hypothetical protein
MGTVFEKFPGVSLDLDADAKIRPFPVAASFVAPLVAGQYVFNKARMLALNISSSDLVVIDGLTIAANVDQLSFSRALNGLFSLSLVRTGNGQKINLAPFQFASFDQGANFTANFGSTGTVNNQEAVDFELTGTLNQTQDLVGVSAITVFITGSPYLCKSGMIQGHK